jgi:hypothetical protein
MASVRLDLDSLTLGEMMAVERASGQDVQDLLASKMGRMTLAVFVQRLRNSGSAPSWNEVEDLRLLDVLGSTSSSSEVSTETTSHP